MSDIKLGEVQKWDYNNMMHPEQNNIVVNLNLHLLKMKYLE